MTDINHADLSRQLAFAIGYAPESVRVESSVISDENEYVTVYTDRYNYGNVGFWYDFDYRDPTVCLPLLEWLMVRHEVNLLVERATNVPVFRLYKLQGLYSRQYKGYTLAYAVARAVIAVGVKHA